LLSPRYGLYKLLVLQNKIKLCLRGKVDNTFLFILAPPFSGSTLLTELIFTSKHVSVNNPYDRNLEGQKLPSVRHIMFTKERMDEKHDFDWRYIKKEWLKYWDLTQPVLLEKSPANIFRALSLQQFFTPSRFIIFYRNPYAHCESFMRRLNSTPEQAASFVIRYLKVQFKNIQDIPEALVLSYELLTNHPAQVVGRLNAFIPELCGFDINRKFKAHNHLGKVMRIQNLNQEKIDALSAADIVKINEVFAEEKDLLEFFGYELMHRVPPVALKRKKNSTLILE
jgi:hypothetical protein